MNHLKYRLDIDGLRAIAVLSVVIYHFFPAYLQGGFTGVDIFFVISGFLITTIIVDNLNNNSFSLKEFYIRRIKRIFPALSFVLASTIVVGYFVLISEQFETLGKHIIGGVFFVANFVLWKETGYFDLDIQMKPLLHLWSLGIEEQYYILFPLFLIALWKLKKDTYYIYILLSIFMVSFSLNLYESFINPTNGFYMPYTRFWELIIGSLLSYSNKKYTITSISAHNIISLIGFILIFFGFNYISKDNIFPGYFALIPTIGASLVIFSKNSILNKYLLSNKIMVLIGLISYPLYLWHWVVFSYAYIYFGDFPSEVIRIILILLSILLSIITYKFVEKPIRYNKYITVRILIIFMLILSIIGYLITCKKITPRIDTYIGETIIDLEYLKNNFFPCEPKKIYDEAIFGTKDKTCFQSKQNKEIDVALWGDSHAQHLFIGLAEELSEKNVVFYMRTGIPGAFSNHMNVIEHLKNSNIKTIIISGYWAQYIPINTKNMALGLLEAIKLLENENRKIYITDDVPNFKTTTPQRCLKNIQEKFCEEPDSLFKENYVIYNDVLKEIKNEYPSIELMNTSQYFINKDKIKMTHSKYLLYRDDNHLNSYGSRYIANKILIDFPEIRN